MTFTPPALAKQWRVSRDKIMGWIRSGELRAINLATRQTGRPRYVIPQESITAFEARRTVTPAAKPQRRKRAQADVTEFF